MCERSDVTWQLIVSDSNTGIIAGVMSTDWRVKWLVCLPVLWRYQGVSRPHRQFDFTCVSSWNWWQCAALSAGGYSNAVHFGVQYCHHVQAQWRYYTFSLTTRPVRPGRRPGARCTGVCVGPRAGLDRIGKSPPRLSSNSGPSSILF